MTLFSSIGIARRLHLVSGALSLAFAGVALLAWVSLGQVTSLVQRTGSVRVPQLQRVSGTELEVTRVLLLLRHAVLARTPQELERALAGIAEKRALVTHTMDAYRDQLFTDDDRARHAPVPPLLATFWAVAAQDTALIEAGRKDEAFAFLVDQTVPARTALLAALRGAVKSQQEALRGELDEVVRQARRTLYTLLALALAAIAGLGLLSWHVAALLGRRVSASRAVAERVRDGDLTLAVHDGVRDEFAPLLAAMDDMRGSLDRVVATVRGNAHGVASASALIAEGGVALSARSAHQAGALQETAAAMEQLGATVRDNAGHASRAERMARDASAVAASGGAVVGEVMATMQNIKDSAARIAETIAVIDAIAFQTYILALNAAVEAARAGAQGRGFAVVASEVRNLAQRSAAAASEIKRLIGGAVERIGEGAEQAGRAGATMHDIEAVIGRVSASMSQISAASIEQSASVDAVTKAVARMDRATQQNCVLVEESAAAATDLKAQAAQLVAAVAVFRQGTLALPTCAPGGLP